MQKIQPMLAGFVTCNILLQQLVIPELYSPHLEDAQDVRPLSLHPDRNSNGIYIYQIHKLCFHNGSTDDLHYVDD